MIDNFEIAKILNEIGEYLEMDEVAFKPQAYQKAASAIEVLDEPLKEIYQKGGLKALEEIPGVGASIAEKIEELLKTGRSKYYEQLRKKAPVNLSELTSVEGVGPKIIKKFYQKLKVRNLADLEKAARVGKIRKLEGFGAKSEENILKSIEFLRQGGQRFVLGFVYPQIENIVSRLKKIKEVEKIEAAGSIRRMKETVGDLDILIVSEKPGPVMDFFVTMPEVQQVLAHGQTKSSVRLKNGMDADLRVVPPESFGAALCYFTGSKEHNIALREIAIKKGKLNEYGLFKIQNQKSKIQNHHVPSPHDSRYFFCTGVRRSILKPMDWSFRVATHSSIWRGTLCTFGPSWPLFCTTNSAARACVAKLMSITEGGWPCAAARFTRRPSARR